MKNIRFYEADKYKTSDYEKVEEKIYKTYEVHTERDDYLALRQLGDNELADKLILSDGWEKGAGDLLKNYLLITYEGKKYYRYIGYIGQENDVVMVNENDPSNPPKEVYVTSIVFEAEPDFGENDPSDTEISQYPLEDILDEFYLYLYDDYERENSNDAVNSYVEFASDDIEDIRKVLTILGKHVYNIEEGNYVKLKIE